MVSTVTTKTLNYAINDGSSTNAVEGTITSTPGFNGRYLGKLPGMLKLFQVILTAVALALVASQMVKGRPYEDETAPRYNETYMREQTDPYDPNNRSLSYLRETFLVGEVYFLCAHSAALTMLAVLLIAYLFHAVSSLVVPKLSTVETVMHLVLACMLIAAGIVEIVMTEKWKYDPGNTTRPTMYSGEYAARLAAGVIALLNGLLFLVGFTMAKTELDGSSTKTLQ